MYENAVRDYLQLWNTDDPAERRDLLRRGWAPEAGYVDPLGEAFGHDAVDQLIGAARDQFPGFRFHLVGAVDGHHRQLRFRWGLSPATDAEPVVVGFDVVVLDDAGRVLDVRGFLDLVPTP
jgi:hypothetical protein